MSETRYKIMLADDDEDDCIFFKEALEDILVDASLTNVKDGVELMQTLNSNSGSLPDLLFLDLNMPRKNGFECLEEIKNDHALTQLPVIIYSTSLNLDVVNLLYEKGAKHYIRKPGDFSKLKKVILAALINSLEHKPVQPPRDKFILC